MYCVTLKDNENLSSYLHKQPEHQTQLLSTRLKKLQMSCVDPRPWWTTMGQAPLTLPPNSLISNSHPKANFSLAYFRTSMKNEIQPWLLKDTQKMGNQS